MTRATTTTTTLAVTAVMAVLAATGAWSIVAPVTSIVKDKREFLERIVNDDRHWTRVLDVRVRIDTAVLTPCALAVLRGLDVIRPEHDEARHARSLRRSSSSRTLTDVADDATVVTVIALDVIVEAATAYYREGDALDLAMATLASAVRCNALPPIAAQVRAVGAAGGLADAARLTAVLDNLIVYADKLARLRDPLAVEHELYAEWLAVIGRVGMDGDAATVDTTAMARLLHDHMRSACDTDDGVRDAQEEDATTAFDAAQATLNGFASDFKVGAMDGRAWRDVLDVHRVLSTANRTVFGDHQASAPAE